MVKIEAFDVLKHQILVLTKLRIYPNASQIGMNLFFESFASYCVVIVLMCYAISAVSFAYVNFSEFTVALRAVIFLIGVSQGATMFYCYGNKVGKIQIVHMKLQNVIDEIVKSM